MASKHIKCRWQMELEKLFEAVICGLDVNEALREAQNAIEADFTFCNAGNPKPKSRNPLKAFILMLIRNGVSDPMIVRAVGVKFKRRLKLSAVERYRLLEKNVEDVVRPKRLPFTARTRH